jgi:DNA-binding NarL/FixJ family response regulator
MSATPVISPAVIQSRPLTDREIQVVIGMAMGKSNAEIGRRLFLSEDTIKTHARKMFRKLGARDRAHAVSLAYQRGILLVSAQ